MYTSYKYVRTKVYIFVNMYIHMDIYIYLRSILCAMPKQIPKSICTIPPGIDYIYTYIYVYMYIYIYIIYIHIYIYIESILNCIHKYKYI
jgi:hypothetical protein